MSMKKYRSPSGYYELNIPKRWCYSEDDNLVSFYDEKGGVGALQISSYSIKDDYDINIVSELAKIISKRTGEGNQQIVSKVLVIDSLAQYSLVKDGKYWKYYMLCKENKLLFLTYNCDEIDSSAEKEVIEKIISSIAIGDGHDWKI